jgi:iron complex outermembrane recepter protein
MNPIHTVSRQVNSINLCLPPLKSAFLAIALILLAWGQQANAQDNPQHYRIPAQSLNNALMQLAAEANLELVFPADNVLGLNTAGLDGTMTVNQALTRLLQGSGITYHFIDARTVALKRLPANLIKTGNTENPPERQSNGGEGQVMPKVTVEADADNPYDDPSWQTDPYNRDYVLPKATAGTKTNTPIMETPLNVQVISKQVLKDQQVIRLSQALRNVSGVTTNSSDGQESGQNFNTENLTLRGFQSETYFRNGFRLQTGSASRELANVESVEVLKGPAAILYGLVEPGGMVNVTTKQPQATPYYALNQQFGSFNLFRTTADATGPLTQDKSLLYRLNFSYENSGSFQDFVFKDNVFLAPVIKWNISPQTQVTLEMEYQHQNQGGGFGLEAFKNGKPVAPISTNYGEPSLGVQDTYFVGLNWSHQFNDDWSIKNQFLFNKVEENAPLFIFPSPFNGIIGNKVRRQATYDQVTTEDTYATNLDLTGHFLTFGLKHTLLLGGDYYRTDQPFSIGGGSASDSDNTIDVFNPAHPGRPFIGPRDPGYGGDGTVDQYGLYLQDQIELPYKVFVMGGFRYQYIDQKSSFNSVDFSIDSDDPPLDAVTPRVGVLWQPQSWLSLYGNYAESFGATNGGLVWPDRKPAPPGSAEQWEVGVKGEWFGGRLRASAAYYDLTKTNITVGDPNPAHSCDGTPLSCVLPVGAIRSRGPELDIQGEILPGWNIIATYAYTDIRIAKTNAANEPIEGFSVGDRFWGVPRNTANFWTTYEALDGPLKGLQVGGGVNIQDSQTTPNVGTNSQSIPGFTTVGLMAGYSFEVGKTKISAQFNVDNLLDKRYYTGAYGSPVSADPVTGNKPIDRALIVNFGAPRTFMGSINVEF